MPIFDFWSGVRDLEPAAFAQRYPDPFLIELGGGGGAASAPGTGHTPTTVRPNAAGGGPPAPGRVHAVVKRQAERPEQILVGRSALNDVVLLARDVSKAHAWLGLLDRAWVVVDLASSYGTTVDGKRLAPHTPERLRSGATIAFSSLQTLFVLPIDFPDTARGLLEAGRI